MVILDPGHGSDTPGKRSPLWPDGSQLFEWEFTRDVVHRIERRLIALNIPCQILVKEARDISLSVRAKRANDIYRQYPNSFGISVHGNAAPEDKMGKAEGWEVWTSPKETESDKIASIIYNQAKVMIPQFKMRNGKCPENPGPDKEAKFTILVKTDCPFILTENGFYDNEKECRFMMSDYGRELIAKVHQFAICSYLQLNCV